MRIVLIGYRGSGKSVVGRLVANRLNLAFVDTDIEIETRDGRSIAKIFAEDGEVGFRSRERDVIADVSRRTDVVIAAGGGAVLDPDTRSDWAVDDTLVVWLTATPEELAGRISGDDATADRRPSLTGRSVLEEITDVLRHREPLYRDCQTLTIDTTRRTIEDVAEEIVTAVMPADPGQED